MKVDDILRIFGGGIFGIKPIGAAAEAIDERQTIRMDSGLTDIDLDDRQAIEKALADYEESLPSTSKERT